MMGTNGTFQISNAARHSAVASAIQQASARTGVDFSYLVNQANVESSMNPNAHAKTSSATGLYQFIEQTWLRMIKSHGAEHGYEKFADAVHQNGNGDYFVANRGARNAILNLRKDPKAASLMAAELATENNTYLQNTLGGKPSATDLYLAHFMGAQGAANFIHSMHKNPWAPAASLFPDAAHSNRGVFYAQGKPLSLQAIYNRFDAKFNGGDAPVAQTQVASNDEGRVVLPLADNWSNPNAPDYQAQVAANSGRSLRAFTSDVSDDQTASAGGFGQKVRWPMDALFAAQSNSMRFVRDDDEHYNS